MSLTSERWGQAALVQIDEHMGILAAEHVINAPDDEDARPVGGRGVEPPRFTATWTKLSVRIRARHYLQWMRDQAARQQTKRRSLITGNETAAVISTADRETINR